MIRQSHIDLMHRELDGFTGAEEREQLRRVLDADAAARAHFDTLLVASAELKKAHRLPPPIDLKASIMAKLAAQTQFRSTRTAYRPGFLGILKGRWKFSTSFHVSVGAVAGAAAVVAFASVFGIIEYPSPADVRGTLTPYGSVPELLLGSCTVSAGAALTDLQTTRTGNQVVATMSMSTAEVAEVQLTYDRADLALVKATANGQPAADLKAVNGQVVLAPTSGVEYRFVFQDNSKAVSLLHLIVTDGHIVARQEVSTGTYPASE